LLGFQAQPVPKPGKSFSLPLAAVRDTVAAADSMERLLWDLNRYDEQARPQQWTILLANKED